MQATDERFPGWHGTTIVAVKKDGPREKTNEEGKEENCKESGSEERCQKSDKEEDY